MSEILPKTDKDLSRSLLPTASQVEQLPKMVIYPQPNSADYWLGYLGIAGAGFLGYMGIWLKKYTTTRLEISIERQKQIFADAKEDRDRQQAQIIEDRARAQKQADIFLTATLSAIQDEKDNNLAALERISRILEKVDSNQSELMAAILEIGDKFKS